MLRSLEAVSIDLHGVYENVWSFLVRGLGGNSVDDRLRKFVENLLGLLVFYYVVLQNASHRSLHVFFAVANERLLLCKRFVNRLLFGWNVLAWELSGLKLGFHGASGDTFADELRGLVGVIRRQVDVDVVVHVDVEIRDEDVRLRGRGNNTSVHGVLGETMLH